MTSRSDIHRPAEFDPADYCVIDYIDTRKPEYVPGLPIEFYERAIAAWREDIFRHFPDFKTGGTDHTSIFTCNHCGHHGLRWVAVVEHIPSGAKLAFGEICADRCELPGRSAFRAKFIKDKAAREQAAREKEAAQAQYAEANPDVVEFLNDVRFGERRETFDFVIDIAGRFGNSGVLTQPQTDAIRRIMVKRAEQQEKRDAEPKPETPLAEGRYVIEGEVLSHKWQESMYGTTHKMLVRMADGNKVWGTVPQAIEDACEVYDEGVGYATVELRGQRVLFTATVERSDNDEHFGFFKRPSKPELVNGEVAATEVLEQASAEKLERMREIAAEMVANAPDNPDIVAAARQIGVTA